MLDNKIDAAVQSSKYQSAHVQRDQIKNSVQCKKHLQKDVDQEKSLQKKQSYLYDPALDYSKIYVKIRLDKVLSACKVENKHQILNNVEKINTYNSTVNQNNLNSQPNISQNKHNHNKQCSLISSLNLKEVILPRFNKIQSPKRLSIQQFNVSHQKYNKNYSIAKVYSISSYPQKPIQIQTPQEQQCSQNQKIKVQYESMELILPETKPDQSPNFDTSLRQTPVLEQQRQISSQIIFQRSEQSKAVQQFNKFDRNKYGLTQKILGSILNGLKGEKRQIVGTLKQIKRYLQAIASGQIDNIDEFNLVLHKKKIVKQALGYERVGIVILAFAISRNIIQESARYLINIFAYALNNSVMLYKLFVESKDSLNSVAASRTDRMNIKQNYDKIRNNNEIIIDCLLKISKNEESFHDKFKELMNGFGKHSLEQSFYQVLQFFAFYLCVSDLNSRMPFLAVAPNPYLQPQQITKYTLVLDVLQIFCHGTKKSKSHVFRPHTDYFLKEMSQYYEIVSFSKAFPTQIDKVIDILDSHHNIEHRLYRHHFVQAGQHLIKDIQRIGRNPQHVILIQAQPKSGNQAQVLSIKIPQWKGNRNDTILAQLCPVLAMVALKKINCKNAMERILEQKIKNQAHGIKYLNFGMNLE